MLDKTRKRVQREADYAVKCQDSSLASLRTLGVHFCTLGGGEESDSEYGLWLLDGKNRMNALNHEGQLDGFRSGKDSTSVVIAMPTVRFPHDRCNY